MTQSIDARFAELVRRAGPAERDPLFRLRVMERREQAQFRRRSLWMLALVLAAASAAAALLVLRPVRLDLAGITLFAAIFATTGVLFAPALIRQLRISKL